MWCFVMWINSHVSGWRQLAKRYQSDETPHGKTFSGIQGQIGLSSYRGVLECTANATGLFLRPGLLFRFGHPQLFIPWTDFHGAVRSSILWLKTVRADIGDPRIVRLRLEAKVFEESEGRKLLDGSGPFR